jgi:hypothetical protein
MRPLNSREIFGTWATILLAINVDESIDFSRLTDEIDFLVQNALNGIYSNGTAGQFYAQTEEEFDRIICLLAERCEKARMPFQIGASYMSARVTFSRLRSDLTEDRKDGVTVPSEEEAAVKRSAKCCSHSLYAVALSIISALKGVEPWQRPLESVAENL